MSRISLAAVVLTALAVAFGAQAAAPATRAAPLKPQNADQSTATKAKPQNTEKSAKKLQKVTVSASLLPAVEYQTMVPTQTIDIKADVNAGLFSTAAMLQTTAVALGSTQINNQFSGFIVGGGTGIQKIDLRGLGAQRTLVLLDGQRPGPAGTRGQTGPFDLNVIPSVILQRIDIVKDSSSSLYGSDAISGVVNLYTKQKMDKPEITSSMTFPIHGGGEQISTSLGTGWNFDKGNIVLAAQFQEQMPIATKQRTFLNCTRDRVWGTNGQRIDRQDRSITGGTPLSGCYNLYVDSIIDLSLGGNRFNPTTDGSTVGPYPGFAPRPNPPTSYANGGTAYYTDVLNTPFASDRWIINRNRNTSFYASSRFHFGSVGWTNQFLYNHRQTDTRGWRQFFPIYFAPNGHLVLPVMPYPSNSQVKDDYYYLRTELDGAFGDSSWSWTVNATHSRSWGEYNHVGIDVRKSGDITQPGNLLSTPLLNYLDPSILNGNNMSQLVNAVGILSRGTTLYTQTTANALVQGSLFSLPAGDVQVALGSEYRRYSIDDQPGAASVNKWEWGYTSATETKGTDHVGEAYAELGVPIVADVPGFKNLVFDVSGRHFKYGSIAKAGNVWKYGLNWQVTDSWRLRGTIGTAFRAPALYELYLGNQSGFAGQLSLDPCIDWGTSTNPYIQKNCAAAGIPSTFPGGSISAKIIQGGGKGFLKPETSRSKSVGVVYTPTSGFNVALDYFDYHIRGEITTLSAANILFGCYGSPVYPNAFCSYFNRNPASAPQDALAIDTVHETYININSERERGFDLQARYNHNFGPVRLVSNLQVTYTTEDTRQLFSTAAASGFKSTNFVGQPGRPKTVGISDVRLIHGPWTFSWQGIFVGSTYALASRTFTYFGYAGAVRDIKQGWQLRHNVSVSYDKDKWGLVVGVRNLFDKQPDLISRGVGTSTGRGNVDLSASQYDYYGRTLFFRAHYKF